MIGFGKYDNDNGNNDNNHWDFLALNIFKLIMPIKNITSIIDVERISFERNSTAITGVMGRIDRAGYNSLTRIG